MALRFTAYVSLLLLLCCCTRDEVACPDGGTAGTARLSVTFVTPASSGSRSTTNPDGSTGDGEKDGTAAESRVSSALVVLASLPAGAITPTEIHSVHKIEKLYPLSGNRWQGELKAVPGRYRLLVAANPTPQVEEALRATVGQPWDTAILTSVTATDYNDLGGIWKENGFLMTNAYTGSVSADNAELVEGREDNKATVSVQRACARFDYRLRDNQRDNIYTISSTPGNKNVSVDNQEATIRITLTAAGLMNVSRGFHLFKQLCSNDAGTDPTVYAHETPTNYVYDTDWWQKKTISKDKAASLFFHPSEASDAIGYKTLPTDASADTPLFYCSENTLPGISRQINCLSTAVVFRGSFTVETAGTKFTDKELYYIENSQQLLLYTSLEQLLQNNTQIDPTTGADDAALAAAGIRHFKASDDGTYPVWYTYWNRHNDNNRPTVMGVMEFAVVRNNIYKLCVNSIGFLGLPKDPTEAGNAWKPDGDTPDELGAQLDVTVTVAGWEDRFYDDEI